MVHYQVRVPGGTLKLKTYRYLRRRERDRKVPVCRVGSIYVIWWSNGRLDQRR
jgi:hypothetical protein